MINFVSIPLLLKQVNMVYAYIRVSTGLQSYDGQKYEIEQWCRKRDFRVDKWTEETVSGKANLDKRILGRVLRRMNRGDTLICTELSRLGRNMMMVMSILNTCSEKGLRIYSIKDNFELSDTLNSKIIAFAFSLAAEIERNLISQRTREALAAKKAAGVKLGRPPGRSKKWLQLQDKQFYIYSKLAGGTTISALADELKVHRNTLSRYLKDTNLELEE